MPTAYPPEQLPCEQLGISPLLVYPKEAILYSPPPNLKGTYISKGGHEEHEDRKIRKNRVFDKLSNKAIGLARRQQQLGAGQCPSAIEINRIRVGDRGFSLTPSLKRLISSWPSCSFALFVSSLFSCYKFGLCKCHSPYRCSVSWFFIRCL
jgi:hypothetical protein